MQMGSFGMGQGQDALQAAMSARQEGGQPVPQLEQTLGNETVPGAAPEGAAVPQSQGKPPTPETELILKALSDRLKFLSKVEEAPQPEMGMDPMGGMGGGYNYR
jgi:hypothetical protein